MHVSHWRCPHEKHLRHRLGFTEPSWDSRSQKGPKNNLRERTLGQYDLYGDELSYPRPLLVCPVTRPNPLSLRLNPHFGMKATEKQTLNATSKLL